MKHISPHKVLFISLLVALIVITLLEFVFADTPELFQGGERLSVILVNVSLSYIAAYFFYIVTFIIPKKIERSHIEEHASHLINMVMLYILFIIQDATNTNVSQKDIKINTLSEEDFRIAMKNIFMDTKLKNFRTGSDGHNQDVGEAVINNINKLRDTVDELFKYSPYIEPELISLISSAIRVGMNESWVNSYQMGPSIIGNQTLVPVRTDVSKYAKHLHEFHCIYKSIEKILLKKYSSTEVSKKYAENIVNIKKS